MSWEYRTLTVDKIDHSGDIGIEVSRSIHNESMEGWEFVSAFPIRIDHAGSVVRLGVVYRRAHAS